MTNKIRNTIVEETDKAIKTGKEEIDKIVDGTLQKLDEIEFKLIEIRGFFSFVPEETYNIYIRFKEILGTELTYRYLKAENTIRNPDLFPNIPNELRNFYIKNLDYFINDLARNNGKSLDNNSGFSPINILESLEIEEKIRDSEGFPNVTNNKREKILQRHIYARNSLKFKIRDIRYVLEILESENIINDIQNYPFVPDETRNIYSRLIEQNYLSDGDINEFDKILNRFKIENHLRNPINFPFIPENSYNRYIESLNKKWQDLEYIKVLMDNENKVRDPENYPFVTRDSYKDYWNKLNEGVNPQYIAAIIYWENIMRDKSVFPNVPQDKLEKFIDDIKKYGFEGESIIPFIVEFQEKYGKGKY